MKTIKPLKLGVLHRTFENAGTYQFVPTFLVCFPFEAPSVGLQEVHLWQLVADELGKETPLDECMPKSNGEVLVSGKAYPPGDEPQPACAARVQLLDVDKKLYVIGDRQWRRSVATDPEPFHEMSIDWTHAFGGEGFAANPVGKGAATVVDEDGGTKRRPLPNVEDPKRLIKSDTDKPVPVGFGAIPLQWPQRMKMSGTYDRRWQKERYPGFPADLDWSFFNTAPPDQWIDGHFSGDESFVVENMHPTEPKLESRLPGFRARCFVTLEGDTGSDEFREIPMHIDTVHLFPNRKRGVVVFRGTTEVTEDDAADIKQLVAACEKLGEPRPMSHYQTVLSQRLDKKKAALLALRDSDLFPPRPADAPPVDGETLGDMEELVKLDNLVQHNMRRKAEAKLEAARDELREHGIDPDEHLPKELPAAEEPPDLEHLADYVDEQMKHAEQARADADRKRDEAMAEVRALCAEHDVDFDDLMARQDASSGGPPNFSADAEFQKVVDQLELARNAGIRLEAAEAKIRDPELMQRLQQTEHQLRQAYRKYAHRFPAARSLEGEEAARLRAAVEASLAAGESLAGRDLTGADLSGMSLRDVDLTGAFLEAANLQGTDLTGAAVDDAVLARANLTDATFTGATVKATNFGEANLLRTDLSGGLDLTGAVFGRAKLVDTKLSGARLDGADFMDAELSNCDLSSIRASKLNFVRSDDATAEVGLDFAGSSLSGAELVACIFLYANLQGCDVSGGCFRESVFLGSKLDGVNFDGTDCTQLRVVHGSSMSGATFRGAQLEGANLRSTDLKGCDFTGATLKGSDLSESDLEDAKLCGIDAPGLLLMKANLKNADLSAANLMEAILQKGNIEGACFKDANLFRADFAKITGNIGTDFEGANMKFIRFVERANQVDG